MQTKALWGIDLGGTKIEGVVLTPNPDFKVLARRRLPTESGKGYRHILNQIKKLIEKLKAETGLLPDRIGFGTPGTLDPISKTLKNSNTTCLNGQQFKHDIETLLNVPAAISNDANCFALAETLFGIIPEKLPSATVIIGLILGTGVGGGIVVNGKVLTGRQGIAGEWGHNILEPNGERCYCGQTGCVETVLSGPALERFYEKIGGEKGPLPLIMERYQSGNDPYAIQTINRLLEYFGKGLAVLVNILDPDAIVIGGGVGNIDLLYTKGAVEVKKYIFNTHPDLILLPPKLGDSAGVFGAALLVG